MNILEKGAAAHMFDGIVSGSGISGARAACLAVMLLATAGLYGADRLPNIVLILADDMGYSDVGSYGSEIATPNIDSLAKEGVRFTQAYNTSKCFPSRAALLTGVYAQQCGYGETYENPIRNAITLGELLRMAGYRTYWSGKHHGIENPDTIGFDRYYGLRDGASNHFNPGLQRKGEPVPARKTNRPHRVFRIDGQTYQPYTPEDRDFYTTDAFTDYALRFLDDHSSEDAPFFLYLSYTAPHDPLMAWPEDIARYKGVYDEGYEATRRARFERQREMGLMTPNYTLSEPTYREWLEMSEAERREEIRKMEVYAAMIDRMDQNIGRVLRKLDEKGVSENTLILFASDNGASAEVVRLGDEGEIGSMERWTSLGGDWANVSNTPLRYHKNESYEGGIRTPLIVRWPASVKETNSIAREPVHFIDVMATFVDITGADYPTHFESEDVTPLQGQSFLPILLGEEPSQSRAFYWEWQDGKAVREGDWKLVTLGSGWELFDLKDDPAETADLASLYPGRVERLAAMHEEWQAFVRE